jgi:hypothetical protein
MLDKIKIRANGKYEKPSLHGKMRGLWCTVTKTGQNHVFKCGQVQKI